MPACPTERVLVFAILSAVDRGMSHAMLRIPKQFSVSQNCVSFIL